MEFQRYSYMGGQLPWKYNQFGNPDSGVSMFFYSYRFAPRRFGLLKKKFLLRIRFSFAIGLINIPLSIFVNGYNLTERCFNEQS